MTRVIVTAVVFLLIGVTGSVAQERIGYAEPQLILDALPERDEIELQLEEFYVDWEDAYNRAYELYSEELYLFQESRDQLSQSQLQSEQRKLSEMAQELQMMQQQFGFEFDQRRAELTEPVVSRINNAIAIVARELNIDMVINSETSEADPILFVIQENPNSINITSRVIEQLTQ